MKIKKVIDGKITDLEVADNDVEKLVKSNPDKYRTEVEFKPDEDIGVVIESVKKEFESVLQEQENRISDLEKKVDDLLSSEDRKKESKPVNAKPYIESNG